MESELKSRILLVDNNEELLQIYFRLLRSAGHDVCLAANGFDALSMARSCLPDLILLGSLLPNIERIELCQRLKADPALNNPHILVLSDSADNGESVSRVLEGGADDYIPLPLTNMELLARVKVHLRLKHTILLLAREIEAHQATQAELRRKERILRLITESIADVLWLFTPGLDRVLYVGPAYESIWGRERKDVYNSPGILFEAVHPEDRERASAAFAGYARGDQSDLEYRIVKPDGSVRWIHERIFPVYEAGGSLSLIAAISRDCTLEKKLQAQAILLESEARLRELAENLRQVIWIRNRDSFLYVNPAYEEVWGLTRESLYGDGTSFLRCVNGEDRDRVRELFLEAHETERADEEFRIIRADGSIRWIRASSVPIREAGKVVRVVGIAQDISTHKAAKEALRANEERLRQGREYYRVLAGRLIRAQEEERSRLARELHDDFSQRVAYLAIEAGRLEGEAAALPGELRTRLSGLREYAAELAEDVSSLSRQIHPAILDELGLIEAIRSECLRFQSAYEIAVQFHASPSVPEIDRETAISIYRLVQEALRNVGKHARANLVTLFLDFRGDRLCLTVADDGIGCDYEAARKKGGLGLASMAERVSLLQGELTFDSHPGSGTVIRACFPV
jgi:PAS domain S-box-containing protein